MATEQQNDPEPSKAGYASPASPSAGHRMLLWAGVVGACALGVTAGLWARPGLAERRNPPQAQMRPAAPDAARRLQIVVDDTPAPLGAPIEVLPASSPPPPAPTPVGPAPRRVPAEQRTDARTAKETRRAGQAADEAGAGQERATRRDVDRKAAVLVVAKTREARREAARAEQARVEQARIEKARVEKARLAAAEARAEEVRLEKVKLQRAKAEKARVAQLEAERIEQVREQARQKARVRQAKLEAAKAEKLRIREAKIEQARRDAERLQLAKLEKVRADKAREDAAARRLAEARKAEAARAAKVRLAATTPKKVNRCASSDAGEALVCADPQLSAADRRLNRAYREARDAGVPEWRLREQQDRWRSARSAAAREAPWQVREVYLARIAELNDMAGEARRSD